jgi:elongation factor 1-beta
MCDINTPQGLAKLSAYLADKSYIDGYVSSKADVAVFKALKHAPERKPETLNVFRWYKHITSFSDEERNNFGESKKKVEDYVSGKAYGGGDAPAAKKAGGDDFDLFGDEEEDAEAAESLKKKAEEAKKKDKKKDAAKSIVILDVKPWDDETDLAKMEECVRSVTMEGLVWGTSKLLPVAFGIKKLQITCVVEDEKVSTDTLEEEIAKFEEYVQSTDIAAFNKL